MMRAGTSLLWALVLVSLGFNAYFLWSARTAGKEASALTERVGMMEWRLEIICSKARSIALCKYDPTQPPVQD